MCRCRSRSPRRSGQPLRVSVRVHGPRAVCVPQQPNRWPTAIKHPLTVETLEKQFGRLGGTGFVARNDSRPRSTGAPMVPLERAGATARDMVAGLGAGTRRGAAGRAAQVGSAPVVLASAPRNRAGSGAQPPPPQLHRALPLAGPAAGASCSTANGRVCRFPGHSRISPGRGDGTSRRGTQIYLATPRIQKPGEIGIFHALARHQADGILVRNLAGLEFFTSGSAMRHRLFVECGQRTDGRTTCSSRGAPRHGVVRPEPGTAGRHGPPRRVDLLEVVDSPAHAACFTWNTACSVPCCRPARTRRTAAGLAIGIRVQLRDRVGS